MEAAAIKHIEALVTKGQEHVPATVKGVAGFFANGQFYATEEQGHKNEDSTGFEFSQLAQFIEACLKFASQEGREVVVNVSKYNEVHAYSEKAKDGSRIKLASCVGLVPNVLNISLRGSRTIDIDGDPKNVILAMYSAYERDDNLMTLIGVLSKIKEVGEQEVEDDGISQKVVISHSVISTGEGKIENPVELKPNMALDGVEMPAIEHIVRLNGAKNVEVFSHDIGWNHKIIMATREHLTQKFEGNDSIKVF